ncbi:MAG TPA: hypothetical protein VFO12_12725 [Sphingomicrobium sp.]|nr:hypothetical protein [Sphingomicrobium sp.]
MNDHGQYYRRRLEAEIEAAEQAVDAGAAEIHRALAELYRQLISESGSGDGTLPPGAAESIAAELPAE